MTPQELKEFKQKKEAFYREYSDSVETHGYSLGCGIGVPDGDLRVPPIAGGQLCLRAYLQPISGSPHPIEERTLKTICDEVIPRTYRGVSVAVLYLGHVYPAANAVRGVA